MSSAAATSVPMSTAQTTPNPVRPTSAPLSLLESFMCGGLAGCAAVTVSNMPEVMKTRLQLQGELQKLDANAPRVYKNVLDVFAKTWRHEGVKGLQRGLMPAYGYQILLNGSRLGFYDPIRRTLNRAIGRDPDVVLASTALLAGALTGCIGAGLGSPLFLVKARIQAYSPALPVGAQHYYKNSFDALRTIVKTDGVRGLWRGVNAAFLRTAMGSSVQLPSYNLGKSYLTSWGWKDNSFATYFVASGISGLCVCAAMHRGFWDVIRMLGLQGSIGGGYGADMPQSRDTDLTDRPADTVLTRMYNQNTVKDPITGRVKGALYTNPIDCLWKTFKAEGIAGWYKGTTAHLLRIWPHTVITLVANELIMTQYRSVRDKW